MMVIRDAIRQNTKQSSCLSVLLLWICIMIPVSALLYGTSAAVREKENELASINTQILAEKDSLRVLHAEWAYLNQPQRLASRAQRYLKASKAALPAQVLNERQLTTKLAYRQMAPAVVATNVQIQPSEHANAPHLLAKPIVFDDHALAALQSQEETKLPSSVTWSQKVVSAFGFSSGSQTKNRLAP
ncbi:MAG: hypothetical protein K2Q32_09360 [Alphaproteobacteria bacterium]|nr:hypothetical protein [Alphaproteobacteria bacterium]